MGWKRWGLGLLLAASIAAGTTACVGPIWSTVDIRAAEAAVAEAESARAAELAPYEYQRAIELLKKAREEWGYSEFGAARTYAEKARVLAEQAREKASVDPWQGPPSQAIERPAEQQP